MDDQDPRHGSYAGAIAHWLEGDPPCGPCERAETRYRKQRKLDLLNGKQRTYTSIGTRRRVRALMALGWSRQQIADRAGLPYGTLTSLDDHDVQRVHARTAEAVAKAYEAMSMTIPIGAYCNRNRKIAARRGWLPPLVWDDIDDENEQPVTLGHTSPVAGECDPVVVERILSGEWRRPCTPAEKSAVIRRWVARGGSQNELERLTRWNVNRYVVRGDAA